MEAKAIGVIRPIHRMCKKENVSISHDCRRCGIFELIRGIRVTL